MSGLSRNIKQLDEELLGLGEEAMLLEELDGFIAGLLACPELIMPGDWLPLVWHEDSADQQPVFEDRDHANRVLGLVMEHYNNVARTLMERPDRCSLGVVDRGLREGRRAAPDSLEEAARRRCRYGGGDERNAAARRHRPGRKGGGRPGLDLGGSSTRQDRRLDRHPQRMAPCQHPTPARHRPKGRHSPEEKGRSQRTVPMRLRKEIQEMLRPQLIVAAVLTGGLLSSKRDRSLADELELPKTLSVIPQRKPDYRRAAKARNVPLRSCFMSPCIVLRSPTV